MEEKQMSETAELILAWLTDQYPKMNWQFHPRSGVFISAQQVAPIEELRATIPDAYGGSNRGMGVSLQIQKLTVTAFLHTRSINKVRSVELQEPTSIDGLKELIDHVLKVCGLPPEFTKYSK